MDALTKAKTYGYELGMEKKALLGGLLSRLASRGAFVAAKGLLRRNFVRGAVGDMALQGGMGALMGSYSDPEGDKLRGALKGLGTGVAAGLVGSKLKNPVASSMASNALFYGGDTWTRGGDLNEILQGATIGAGLGATTGLAKGRLDNINATVKDKPGFGNRVKGIATGGGGKTMVDLVGHSLIPAIQVSPKTDRVQPQEPQQLQQQLPQQQPPMTFLNGYYGNGR